jgi:hypothetical protein
MSNPLKRVLNFVDEASDVTVNASASAIAGDETHPPYLQDVWQPYNTNFLDAPRQSQYHGPSYMNPQRYGGTLCIAEERS